MKAILIGMTDFVLREISFLPNQTKNNVLKEDYSVVIKSNKFIYDYANFLKRPLTLGQFIPCDLDGNFLEEPIHIFSDHPDKEHSKMYQNSKPVIEYKEVLERVIFSEILLKDIGSSFMVVYNGTNLFRFSKNRNKLENREPENIEDLVKYNLTLTDSISKELGLTK